MKKKKKKKQVVLELKAEVLIQEEKEKEPHVKFAADGGSNQLRLHVEYALLLLRSEVTVPALLTLTKQILNDHCCLPVGEIGKLLQEATSNSGLSSTLKERFGGLKRFIEGYPDIFLVSTDHRFNPLVYLCSALTAEQALIIKQGGGGGGGEGDGGGGEGGTTRTGSGTGGMTGSSGTGSGADEHSGGGGGSGGAPTTASKRKSRRKTRGRVRGKKGVGSQQNNSSSVAREVLSSESSSSETRKADAKNGARRWKEKTPAGGEIGQETKVVSSSGDAVTPLKATALEFIPSF